MRTKGENNIKVAKANCNPLDTMMISPLGAKVKLSESRNGLLLAFTEGKTR